jgi:hypothetical protein
MITYRSSPRSRSGANGAHVLKGAVCSYLGGSVNSDRTTMRNKKTGPNFSVGVNVDKRHHDKQLSYDEQRYPCRCPHPLRATLPNHLLEPVQTECPESLRAPCAIAARPETRPIRAARPPLAVCSPCLDGISVVPLLRAAILQRIYLRHFQIPLPKMLLVLGPNNRIRFYHAFETSVLDAEINVSVQALIQSGTCGQINSGAYSCDIGSSPIRSLTNLQWRRCWSPGDGPKR